MSASTQCHCGESYAKFGDDLCRCAGASMLDLNVDQLRILRHMLGIDRPDISKPVPTRDYYCANPGEPVMQELVRVGAICLYDTRGGYEWFKCTPEGRASGIASQKTIRYSPAKMRYSRFLDMRDCFPDLTFREYLTNPRYSVE